MKKISIILPDLRGGGAERLHIYLANHWVKLGYYVEMVLIHSDGELIPLLDKEIHVINLLCKRIRDAIFPLRRHFMKSKPDVILSAMWPLTTVTVLAWIISNRIGRIYLIDHVYLTNSCLNELKIKLSYLAFFMNITYPMANGIIAVSNGVKKNMLDISKLKSNSIKVIYNPAATGLNPYRGSDKLRDEIWGGRHYFNILSVGSLKTQKDHATLIKAFSLLPTTCNAKLIILGDGELRNELTDLILHYGLQGRVLMPGFILDPSNWFRTADLFVNASRWDGLPLVLIEALEYGLPIVSTDCPHGPSEILQDGKYGTLVPVGDQAALSSAINNAKFIIHDRDDLMLRAKDFSISKISTEYLSYMFPNEL